MSAAMGAQETSITHSALGWVKKSIDDNLAEIEVDLKHYIEKEDGELLERVKERLGVIQGVLMMIEHYGASMLAEEMVALVDFIAEQRQDKGEQALEVLLRAVLQLPDYLEHIQSGHRDIPIAILPLLNDIRSVRNQDLFSEKLLFLPDLSMHQHGAEPATIDEQQNQASKLLAKKLRPVYQLALVNIIKEQSVEESLKRLEKVCETLEERSVSEQIARIWWIVGALIESVSRQQLELGVSIKNLLGKVDALFRVILIIGERGLLRRQPIELIKNFLYYIAQPECDGPKAQAIKTAYRLEQFLPSESARSEVLSNIAGPNQALLKTVAEAMKADIEEVKSTLEVYVNGDLNRVSALKDLPQEMHVISDTLAMIGLGQQRQLIEAQIEVVKSILNGDRAADEEQLLSMAAELIQVEQALDQMPKRQPSPPAEESSEADASQAYQIDSVLSAVVTAALDDIQKTKSAILEFIKDSSNTDNIDLCVALMEESRGAMQLLDQPRAVEVIDGLLTYLKGYDIVEFMEASRLDALSQVVVSLEYYLEALGEHRKDAEHILDLADTQLKELLANVRIKQEGEETQMLELVTDDDEAKQGDDSALDDLALEPAQDAAPPAEDKSREAAAPEPPAPPAAGTQTMAIPVALDTSVMEIEEIRARRERQPQAPAAPAPAPVAAKPRPPAPPPVPAEEMLKVTPVEDDLEVLKPGSDEDILEIYLEEAQEESQNIARLQKDWLLHPEDENALKNIRRAFHTIKGSGRLVGAMKIGEFAWDYEQLLNRVIDKTIPPDQKVIEAVGKAAKVLPELVEELKSGQPPKGRVAYLRGLARALAEFRADQLLVEHTQLMKPVQLPDDRAGETRDTRWKDPVTDASTKVVPQQRLVEPDTVRVDSAGRAAGAGHEEITFDETEQLPTEVIQVPDDLKAGAESGFDATEQLPTEVMQVPADLRDEAEISFDETEKLPLDQVPRPDPGTEIEPVEFTDTELAFAEAATQYTQAIDYARAPAPGADETDAAPAAEAPAEAETEEELPDSIGFELPDEIGVEFDDEVDSAAQEEAFATPREEISIELEDETDAEAQDEFGIELEDEVHAEAQQETGVEFDDEVHAAEQEEISIEFGDQTDAQAQEDFSVEFEGEVDDEPEDEIRIEAIGDDFVGDGDLEDTRGSLEYDLTGVYQVAADADAGEAGDEDSDTPGDATLQAEEPEAEEIVMRAEEPEAEEIVMQAEEPEAEEIVMRAEEPEAEEIVMQAEEPEAEEIVMQSEEPEPDEIVMETRAAEDDTYDELSDEAEFGGMALEASFDDVAADSRPAGEDSAEEGTHDPFVETTMAPMPGKEAGATEPETREPEEPTGLSFDPELLIIYQQEVEQHLGTVSSALERAENVGELIPGEELYRALHTIHGASRTADISSIGKLADLMEKPLKSAIAQRMALDLEIVALYREGQRALHAMTSELVETRQLPVIPEDLKTSFEALAEDFEEHTVEIPEEGAGESGSFVDTLSMMNEAAEPEQDEELLTIFIDEANELLEMSDNTLHEWERQSGEDKTSQDFGAVMELQRYLHTLKGGARMAELAEISDLSHELESMFIAVIDGRVEKNENLLELLKDSFDLLHRQVSEAQEGRPMSDSSDMVKALRELRLEEGEQPVEEIVGDSTIVDSEAINIVSENLPEESLTGVERQSQDVIKVRSDLLDNLVNAAGEASIYRARMEQQVAGLGSYLGELGQTIARLKIQLRSLEAETEAQIHYSHRTESGRSDFDPLEMDRYTMIQELSRSLGESVNDLSSLQTMLGDQVKDSETLLLQQSRVNTDLQDGLRKSRMV